MNQLIYTEWLKIKKYNAFWWMTAIVALTYPGVNYIIYSQVYKRQLSNDTLGPILKLLGNPFTFPDVWQTVAYVSSWFVFIPSIVVIMFITNEYTYKTHRQNIIDGWSRNQFMWSKVIDVLIITLLATVLYIGTSLVIGYLNIDESGENIWGETKFIGLFLLMLFSQLSVAFLIAFLTKRAFVALGIFLFYSIMLEPIIVGFARDKANDLGKFMPLEVSERLVPLPKFMIRDEAQWEAVTSAIGYHVVYTIIFVLLTWFVCFWINSRRDLK